jgi:uncharacterized protein YhaN
MFEEANACSWPPGTIVGVGREWSDDDRRELADLDQLLRSLALSPKLPPEQLARLLARHRALLQERHDLEQVLVDLAPAWREARAALNRLHALLQPCAKPLDSDSDSDADADGPPAGDGARPTDR